jgi:hypothetical protein
MQAIRELRECCEPVRTRLMATEIKPRSALDFLL